MKSICLTVAALTLTACGAPFTYADAIEATDAGGVGISEHDASDARDAIVSSKDGAIDALDEMNVSDASDAGMVNVDGSASDDADAAEYNGPICCYVTSTNNSYQCDDTWTCGSSLTSPSCGTRTTCEIGARCTTAPYGDWGSITNCQSE